MTLRTKDVESAGLSNLGSFDLARGNHLGFKLGQVGLALFGLKVNAFGSRLANSETCRITAQQDVHASTRHIRGHGHCAGSPRLGDNLGLAEMLLGVKHLVGNSPLLKKAAELL